MSGTFAAPGGIAHIPYGQCQVALILSWPRLIRPGRRYFVRLGRSFERALKFEVESHEEAVDMLRVIRLWLVSTPYSPDTVLEGDDVLLRLRLGQTPESIAAALWSQNRPAVSSSGR